MSTTHPTNITTEWDDIQRKYGNLPKLEKEKTNEELDSEFVEITEQELLRESRLKEWKKKLSKTRSTRYGSPVNITASNFVEQVTNSSKYMAHDDVPEDNEYRDLSEKTGYYIPVLLLNESKESGMLRDAWNVLARRYPDIKFTIGSSSNVLKVEPGSPTPPSSVLLYFSGSCVFQKNVSSLFRSSNFELSDDKLENRLANLLENLLNGTKGHFPLVKHTNSDEDSCSESSSDSDSDSKYIKKSGKDFKTDFLNKLNRGRGGSETSKGYTSWILDKALGN